MLECLDHLLSILSSIIMGIVGLYTAYLTIWCKKVKLVSHKVVSFSGEKEHMQLVVQIYNPSLSPICITSLYLIYNEKYFITLKEYVDPLIIPARTVVRIESCHIWEPSKSFLDNDIYRQSIYLLAFTNKGVTYSSFNCSKTEESIFSLESIFSFLKHKNWARHTNWTKNKNYRKLESIKYTAYNDKSNIGACITSTINENKCTRAYVVECKIRGL